MIVDSLTVEIMSVEILLGFVVEYVIHHIGMVCLSSI